MAFWSGVACPYASKTGYCPDGAIYFCFLFSFYFYLMMLFGSEADSAFPFFFLGYSVVIISP